MGKAVYALIGSLLGGWAFVALSYNLSAEMNIPVIFGSTGPQFVAAFWFTFIGVVLGALGGLAVERWRSGAAWTDREWPD